MTPHPQPHLQTKDTFVTLYNTRLFTAEQVWEMANAERPRTPAPAQDDIDLEELGNQDIDPKVFEAYARACDKGAQEQFLMEQIRKAREEYARELYDTLKSKRYQGRSVLEITWDDVEESLRQHSTQAGDP